MHLGNGRGVLTGDGRRLRYGYFGMVFSLVCRMAFLSGTFCYSINNNVVSGDDRGLGGGI